VGNAHHTSFNNPTKMQGRYFLALLNLEETSRAKPQPTRKVSDITKMATISLI
jgi:hypothetical protein